MSSKITSITLVRDKLLETDVFPKKNGDRFHTTFAADVIPDILKKEDKCILTLLKDKTYSLSIKLKVNSNTVNSFKDSFDFDNIYIFDKNKNCFELNTITTYDILKVSHILIIGTAYEPNAPAEAAAQFEFNGITKIFLIINSDETRNTPKYTDVTIEEYLNLYYIEHFSLNIIEFSDLYKKYKNNTEEESGGQREAAEEPEAPEGEGEEGRVAPEVGEGRGEVGVGQVAQGAQGAPGAPEVGEAAGGVEGAAGEGGRVALVGRGEPEPEVEVEEGAAEVEVEVGVKGRQGGGGGTEMTGKKKTVKKIKKNKK
jgi:hypothetical protein